MSIHQGLKLSANARAAFERWAESPTVERRTALLQTIVELEHQVANGNASLPRVLRAPENRQETTYRFTKGYES